MILLMVLAALATVSSGQDIFDVVKNHRYLGSFKYPTHLVQGEIYLDPSGNKLLIHRFYYDGKGPGGIQFMFVVKGVKDYARGIPMAIEERGYDDQIEGEVLNEDLSLVIPEGLSANDLDRLVFWCQEYGVSFGRMDVDERGPRPKAPIRFVGPIIKGEHAVSGDVYIMDDRTLYIANFNYDGTVRYPHLKTTTVESRNDQNIFNRRLRPFLIGFFFHFEGTIGAFFRWRRGGREQGS